MRSLRLFSYVFGLTLLLSANVVGVGQTGSDEEQFGPVVRAYLGYLRNEQEVTDDRASRHEVSRSYYMRNSNRIRALRQMAVKIATDTQNDYLPELEAVAGDELGLILERPPRPALLRIGEVFQTTFRYLGAVRAGEVFHVFARLDPYEQSELREKARGAVGSETSSAADPLKTRPLTRARRVTTP